MPDTTFRAVIIDDEHKAQATLKVMVDDYCPEIDVVETFGEGKEALQYLMANEVDLIFLDIKMPTMSGFELIENLRRKDEKIVIVSAHDEHGIKAVKVGAFDYLLKPISISDLTELVKKLVAHNIDKDDARNKAHGENDEAYKVTVPHNHGFKIIDIRTVVRIESDNSYSILYFISGEKLLVTRSIKEFQSGLTSYDFYRVHNKHLISIKHVEAFTAIDGGVLKMINGDEIPVSRRKVKEFKDTLKGKFDKLNE